MYFKAKTFIKILFLLSLICFVPISLSPKQALAATQMPTVSVNPSSIIVTNSNTTINVAVSQVQNLNAIHFVLSFNDGPVFLNMSTQNVAAGNLFSGYQPTLTLNQYYLNSTGRSYLNALFELSGNKVITTTGTTNVAALTFGLLSNAVPGMKSGLNLESADILFFNGSNYDYVDEQTGITLQGGSLTMGYLTTSIAANNTQAMVEKPVSLSSKLMDGLGKPLAGLSVDYYVNSQKVGSGITDVNGISTYLYTPTNVGTFSLFAQYVGNQPGGIYAQSNSTATLTVTQLSTSLTLSMPASLKVGIPVYLAATLQKGTSPIGGSTVGFSVLPPNGSWIPIGSAITDSTGMAQVSYTFNTVGNFGVKADFSGTASYASCSANTTVTLAQSSTTIKLTITPTLTLKVGQTITLASAVKDQSGNALVGRNVDYYVNSQKIGSATTDTSGSSSIQYTPTGPSPADGWKAQAQFSGEAAYGSSTDSLQVVVNQVATTTSLTITPSTITIEQQTALSATLKDENSKAIPSSNIDFYGNIAGQMTKLGSATTDSNGLASLNYIPTTTGNIMITANFTGSPVYVASGSSQGALSVNMLATSISLNIPAGAKVNQLVTLSAILKDANQKSLSGMSIDFTVVSGGLEQTVGSAQTDQNGTATIPFTPITVVNYQVKAEFKADAKYLESSDSKTLSVASILTSIAIQIPSQGKVGDVIPVTATLSNDNNSAMPGVSIDFSMASGGISNSMGTDVTNSSSMASRAFIPSEAGTFTISARFAGDSVYTAASKDVVITISKIDTAINLTLSNSTAKTQTYVLLSAALTDGNQLPVDQASIEFQVYQDGIWIQINSATTNSQGIASTAYKPDKTGSLLFQAIYSGNAKYVESTSAQAVLEVTEDNLVLSALPYIIAAVIGVVIVALVLVMRRRKST